MKESFDCVVASPGLVSDSPSSVVLMSGSSVLADRDCLPLRLADCLTLHNHSGYYNQCC